MYDSFWRNPMTAAILIASTATLTACGTGSVGAGGSTGEGGMAGSGAGGANVGGTAGNTGTGGLGGAGDGGTSAGGAGEGGGGEGGAGGAGCVGFHDPLQGQSFGVVDGGQFTNEGWLVTSNGQQINWPNQRIASEGSLEFDVKGLTSDQLCGNQSPTAAGKCRLWWFGANDESTPKQSQWSATGRTISGNFTLSPPDDPNDYIDKVRLGVTWLSLSPQWSATAFDWNPSTWYHMKVEWTCLGLEWTRSVQNSEELLVAMPAKNGNPDCYQPESDPETTYPATAMEFMVGGGIFGAVGATFKNVEYLPVVCSDVVPLP